MAEGVLFSIAEEIIKKLGTLAAQDVALWWGLKDQLRKLNDTVTKIKAMIPDAEALKQNHEIEDWLKKLQEAVYDVEDGLDSFSTQVLRKQLTSGIGASREVCAFLLAMRPILSAPPPAKSVPISPAHLAGSPHYSPSSNKVSKKSYEKMRR